MKKAIVIILVLIAGTFFLFFDITIGPNHELDFIENYKTDFIFYDYEAETVISTNENEEGFRLTFIGCQIDSTNIEDFSTIGKKMAKEINGKLNDLNEFGNIILIFKPSNKDGIRINEIMSIEELKYTYKTKELITGHNNGEHP